MKKEIACYKLGYRITNRGLIVSKTGIYMSGGFNSNGYKKFNVRINGKINPCLVHRQQAFQKYGIKLFEPGIEVRHKNGIKEDNSFDNILIGTHSQNMMDIPEDVRMNKSMHATSFVRKYDRVTVINFHEKCGNSYKKTMEKFNISSKGTLHFILNGKKVL